MLKVEQEVVDNEIAALLMDAMESHSQTSGASLTPVAGTKAEKKAKKERKSVTRNEAQTKDRSNKA